MPHPLETKLSVSWPPKQWADVTVVAAVSGGCDSVALLRALSAIRADGEGRLVAAHLNHRLRPEADEDERFVVDLCRRLGVECEVGQASVRDEAEAQGDGLESAARVARYRFLRTTAERLGARFVVTAHTADDQAETILHRIIRGTGIRGLAGMARVRRLGHASLVRPMLNIRREELAAYLAGLGQPFRDDASNADCRFTRNRIRHELLPLLRERFNTEAADALRRLGSLAGRSQAVIDSLVDQLLVKCTVMDNRKVIELDLAPLVREEPYLVGELFAAVWRRRRWPMQSMGQTQWHELADMAASPNIAAKRDFPGGVSAEVADGRMRLIVGCVKRTMN